MSSDSTPARNGGIAGALAGVGALLGLAIGMVLQFWVLGGQEIYSEFSAGLSNELGYSITPSEYESTLQWMSISFVACCLGLANVAIMASAGAGGAAIYASRHSGPTTSQTA